MLNFLKKAFKKADVGLDILGTLNVPIAKDIDAFKDAIKATVDSGGTPEEVNLHVAMATDQIKGLVAGAIQKGVEFTPGESPWSSKKFLSMGIGIVSLVAALIAAKLGVDRDLVELAIYGIVGVVASHQGAQGIVDFIKARMTQK